MKVRIFSSILTLMIAFLGAGVLGGCGDSPATRKQKFLARGNASLQQIDEQQALYYFGQALAIDSCFSSALNNIGTVHFNGHRYDEALEYYNRAIECNPDFLDAYFNRANALIKDRNYSQAVADLDHVLTIKPDTGIAHFNKGLALSRVREYDAAVNSFSHAASLDTSLVVESRVNIAAVNISLRRYNEAELQLRECLELDPGEANIYNSLALIKSEQKMYDSALVLVNRALSMLPDEPYFLNNRGYIHLNKSNLQAAEVDINRSITIDPFNGWAYRNKGILNLLRGSHAEALRLLERAQQLDPQIDRLHYYLGLAYFELGRIKESCSHFQQSVAEGDNMVSAEQITRCKNAR